MNILIHVTVDFMKEVTLPDNLSDEEARKRAGEISDEITESITADCDEIDWVMTDFLKDGEEWFDVGG